MGSKPLPLPSAPDPGRLCLPFSPPPTHPFEPVLPSVLGVEATGGSAEWGENVNQIPSGSRNLNLRPPPPRGEKGRAPGSEKLRPADRL